MNFSASEIDYQETGFFSKIINDYLQQSPQLQSFYSYAVNEEGIAQSIAARKESAINHRQLLVSTLKKQYSAVENNDLVNQQIDSLLNDNTFTICTAHQPNIFTGHLYFIYKILHTIKLADHLKTLHTAQHFVPVFYMGSEDADLEELGHIFLYGDRYTWKTAQTGAVGRMVVDDYLIKLIDQIKSRVVVEKYGGEIINIIESCYVKNRTIGQATFQLIHTVFSKYGLVVLLPDDKGLKSVMVDIFNDDLFNGKPSEIVDKTVTQLNKQYKVQANPREINLFYLIDNKRERIVFENDSFFVLNTKFSFSKEQMETELKDFPERFSPNVILRGIYQETILPNIAFVGGGGELAYWLELKSMFEHYNVPFPALILRNSFLLISKQQAELLKKLNFTTTELFKPEKFLADEIVRRESEVQLSLKEQKEEFTITFSQVKSIAVTADVTLAAHCEMLLTQLVKKIDELEKKMLRAEMKRHEASLRQLSKLKHQLFPNDGLQERVDNFLQYFSVYGKEIFDVLLENSLSLEQRFKILVEE